MSGEAVRTLVREIDPRLVYLRRVAPAAPAPYYTLELFAAEPAETPVPDLGSLYYVPSADAVRAQWEWPSAWRKLEATHRLRELVAGLAPFSRPSVERAAVDRRPAQDPGSYLRLYELGGRVSPGRDPVRRLLARGRARTIQRDWIFVDLDSRRPSPWTDDTTFIWLERRGNRLVRDGQTIELRGDLAKLIRRREPVPASSRWSAPAVGGAVAGAALLVLGLVGIRGRKRWPRTLSR